VALVQQTPLRKMRELDAYENECLECGFEGVMLRDPHAGYKNGRSTAREGVLLKLKRFADAEAVIIGLEEQRDLRGKPNAVLGALHVRDLDGGVDFSIGTGFSGDERLDFWGMGKALVGLYVRYRHFPSGAAGKPRFPVFAGLRSGTDMGAVYA
jgi:DNA ligase-1